MQTITDYRDGSTFETELPFIDALLIVKDIDGEFAQSLYRKSRSGSLSDRQMFWIHKLAHDRSHPPTPVEEKVVNVSSILKLFETAKQHLKYPKIRFALDADCVVRLSLAGERSKYPGSIQVTSDDQYESRVWYGRIETNGVYVRAFREHRSADLVAQAIHDFASDPAEYASKYGRLVGSCCFCNQSLTDDRSTAVGYGKKCASHYGLLWGVKAADEPVVEEPEYGPNDGGIIEDAQFEAWSTAW